MRGCMLSISTIVGIGGVGLMLVSLSNSPGSGPGAPLEGVVGGVIRLAGVALIIVGIILFWFTPNAVVPEISRSQLTGEHVDLVTQHTSIVFPAAARLVGLCHADNSLASHVAAKFEIPDSCREIFLQNSIFHKGRERSPHYELGSSTAWWRRNKLLSRIDRVQYLPSGTYIECCVGIEKVQTVAYVSWA